MSYFFFFFFQSEDGIRDVAVTGVQTCALPIYPTGHPASPATAVRPDLLTTQLRLQARTPGARRGARGAAVHPGRTPVGGGRGPGEVLRPGQPRCADGKAGEAHGGRAVAGAHPSLPRSGHHGRRRGDGAARGDAARRPPLTALGECAPRRRGQGAGEAWARLRALRRRLQRVRAVPAGGRGRDADAATSVREAPAAGQRGEERGGATVGPQVPRLQLLGGPGRRGQAARGPPGPRGDEGPGADHDGPQPGAEPRTGHAGPARLPRRLAGVLSAGRHAGRVRRPGQVGPPSPASGPPQAVETRTDRVSGTAGSRPLATRSRLRGPPHAPLVVERKQVSSRRAADTLLRRAGSPAACDLTSTFRTAGCGPACPVVWEGSGGDYPPPPIPINQPPPALRIRRGRSARGPGGGASLST